MRYAGFAIILFRSVLMAAMIPLFVPSALAQKAGCPTWMGNRADRAQDKISTWSGLFDWYHRYRACDDGETADGIDDAVAKLFGGQWNQLMRETSIVDQDPGLRHFLLRHIDVVGMSPEQARELQRQATLRCPTANAALCRDIAREAIATVREATQ